MAKVSHCPSLKSTNFTKIIYTQTCRGPEGLSVRATRYWWWLVSAAKIGQWVIAGTCGELAASIYRAQGQTRSVRTLRSAFVELAASGWISVRPGRRGIIITLDRSRFTYWTRTSCGNIIPITTVPTYTDSRQDLPVEDRTIKSTSDIRVLDKLDNKRIALKSKSHAKYSNWINPILFTIRCLLRGAPDRFGVEVLAASELAGDTELCEVPWGRYSGEWQRMSIAEREGIARSWFLPALRAVTSRPAPSSPPSSRPAPSSPPSSRPAPSSPPSSRPAPSSLGRDELAILTAARNRARSRHVWR